MEKLFRTKKKWSYGLYSILLFEYPEDIRITRKELLVPRGWARPRHVSEAPYLHAEVIGEPTLVVVDGIPVLEEGYDIILGMPSNEILSVELIKFAENFSELYADVFPHVSPMDAPTTGNVMAYTHGGHGVHRAIKPKDLLEISVSGFSPEREFYAPKYESSSKESSKPDLRSLIHWTPRVEVDSTGKASVEFFNADGTGELLVVVEAISEAGKLANRK